MMPGKVIERLFSGTVCEFRFGEAESRFEGVVRVRFLDTKNGFAVGPPVAMKGDQKLLNTFLIFLSHQVSYRQSEVQNGNSSPESEGDFGPRASISILPPKFMSLVTASRYSIRSTFCRLSGGRKVHRYNLIYSRLASES
jgi:hypothetical protein